MDGVKSPVNIRQECIKPLTIRVRSVCKKKKVARVLQNRTCAHVVVRCCMSARIVELGFGREGGRRTGRGTERYQSMQMLLSVSSILLDDLNDPR
jgi:hypothetical protein